MSTDSESPRPSFRFRDKFSRLKDKVKDKLRDKTTRQNVTYYVHQNLTSNDTHEDYSHTTRHGFRQHMHHYKDVLKNKTHYESIKHKIKDKIDDKLDLHDNKTYPKGFYDSLFSPENENDVYLQTALICLWVIAVLCIIPTIVVIFLPSRKKKEKTTSTNMIFFHVFFCELCYLTYILLAMINVAKDFRLGSTLCDIANYGMYVTIPIMQFALLFLSLERLSKHFQLAMTWAKIFTKPYLIQMILCAIWIFLLALLMTFMFIRKQFHFSFVKDTIKSLAPPIVGDVATRWASRRHHCSIDGRLSSVFKTVIIILFIILIIKPIVLSLGFNLLTPYCCKNKRKVREKQGDRRTTNLVTIFLLLNFFFSFPFYFTSMFKSIFTRIDSTKDTFSVILKICFILRITNIIFESLAFYIFERNSWSLLSKIFYYGTCKKFPIFKTKPNDEALYTKDPKVLNAIEKTRDESTADDDEEERIESKTKPVRRTKSESEDDDGALVKKHTRVESDEEVPVIKSTKKRSNKKKIDEDETEKKIKKKTKSKKQKVERDEDESEELVIPKRKSSIEETESDDEEETEKVIKTTKRKSRPKKSASEDEDDEEEPKEVITTTRRKARTKKSDSDDEENEKVVVSKRKSHPKVEEEELIEKPKSKPHHNDVETRIPNGTSTSKTKKSTEKHSSSAPKIPQRRRTPSPQASEAETASNTSQSPKPPTKPRRSSTEHKPTRTKSPSSTTRPRTKPTTTSNHPTTKPRHNPTKKSKKPKKDHHTRILEMSDDV